VVASAAVVAAIGGGFGAVVGGIGRRFGGSSGGSVWGGSGRYGGAAATVAPWRRRLRVVAVSKSCFT